MYTLSSQSTVSHRLPRFLHALLLGGFFGLLTLGLSACGGAASAGADLGSIEEPTPPDTPPDEDPDPDAPVDTQLDLQLLAALLNENLDLPPAPPARDGALVSLGHALFFDKVLSGNRDISCATCHHPTAGSGDDLSLSIGAGGSGTGAARQLGTGSIIPRNAPALFNRGLRGVDQMFWDSRVRVTGGPGQGPLVLQTPEAALNGPNPSATEIVALIDTALAAQSIFPLLSAAEMRGAAGTNEIATAATNLEAWALLVQRLVGSNNGSEGGIAAYRTLFSAAYPNVVDFDVINIGHVARALGAYEQTAYTAVESPFDAYRAGERTALTDSAKRGALLFYGRADCSRCHEGPLFTDNRHHAIAIPQIGPGRDFPGEDTGREAVTGDADDRYEFRTPQLRNTAVTGPWMHDGAYTTLEAVIRHYDNPVGNLRGYDQNQLAPLLRGTLDTDANRVQARADALSGILRPSPNLRGRDVGDLAAFLRSLTDPRVNDLTSEIPTAVPSGLSVGD